MGDQSVQIAKGFILSAPPGEVKDVVRDVNVLLGGGGALQEHLPGIMREYNIKHGEILKGERGERVVVCSEGEVDSSTYIDPAQARKVTVDHVKGEILSVEPLAGEVEGGELRAAAQEQVTQYVKTHLSDGCGAVHGSTSPDGELVITCRISGTKLNPRNFWNGRWTSFFFITVPAGASSAPLKGRVSAAVHTYEDGNVQLDAKKDVEGSLSWSSPATFGSALVKQIQEAETALHHFIDDSCGAAETPFKSLRRKMPITQTKFQWNKIAAYSLAKELQSK